MSDSTKAVFLSYASQDAAAAQKICEALRAAGVEVWFDQSELRGGDSWDAKIRRQIKECALFVPIISSNTQARGEGYFRLEWKLAVDRSHLMAEDAAFLFPIIIDDVPNAAARVPDKFREVQWTRLRLDETPTELAARVAKLLRNEWPEAAKPDEPSVPARAQRSKRRPGWVRTAWTIVGLSFAVIYLFKPLWRGPRSKETPPAPPEVTATATPGQDDARHLADKARELFLGLDSTKDDFELAEDMLKQAVAKAPGDAEVWAAYAQLHLRYQARGWDYSDERREAARVATQRALRLDPTSFEARYAAAMRFSPGKKENEESERALRALLRERPADKRVLRSLGSTLRYVPGHDAEAIELYDRAAQLPGGDPLALYNKALALWFAGRAKEANAAIAASVGQQPFVGARLLEAYFSLSVDGDLDHAAAVIAQLPAATLAEDRGCFFAYLVHSYRNEPEQALAVVKGFSRDWLSDNWFRGPRGLLAGNALAQAGQLDAATVEWRAALKVVDQRLVANPNDLQALGNRLLLLAKLGDTTAARQLLPTVRQMLRSVKDDDAPGPPWFAQALLAMGDQVEAMRLIDASLKSKRHAVFYTASDLRHDPTWESVRTDPEFVRLIAEADRVEGRSSADAGTPAASASPDPKSVAVLAFANLSDDKDNEYFSDGISEELLTVLQKVPGLHVAARTSSFSFKGRNATAQEIGEKLGVANVVEGSVRKAGNTVRITVHLSRAATGEERWSESYTRELKDVFALQEQLALAIVGELRGQLVGGESDAVKAAVKGGTRVPEAYQQYLQGRYFANRHSEKNIGQALAFFQRAVELDSNFALAWAGLARAHVWYCEFSTDVGRTGFEDHLAKARAAVDRALALEPGLAESLLAKSEIQLNLDFDWKGADESLRVARAQAPADPELLIAAGNLAGAMGDNVQATALFQQAVNFDPVNSRARSFLAYQFASTGRLAEAEAEYPRVLELNPDAPWAHAGLGMAYLLRGRYEDAAKAAKGDAGEWAELLIVAAARWGQHRQVESDAALGRLIAQFADTAAYQIAEVYAYRGEKDAAFEWLGRARRQRDGGIVGLQVDPLFAKLQSDTRWPKFLKELGLAPAPAT